MFIRFSLFLIPFTLLACGTSGRKSDENLATREAQEKSGEANGQDVPSPHAQLSQAGDASALVLKVIPRGLKDGGQFCLSVFDKKESFPNKKDGSVYAICQPLAAALGGIEVSGLKQNVKYAVAIFHDKNSNGKLDTKKLLTYDVPTEGFGFSKNPGLNRFGPPLFDETALTFATPKAEISIDLLYLF